jgi:hypothetical protein
MNAPNYHLKITDYIQKVKERSSNFLGYPVSIDFEFNELYELLNM